MCDTITIYNDNEAMHAKIEPMRANLLGFEKHRD